MAEYLIWFKNFVIALGEKHNVDPLTLGLCYLVSKVSLVVFLGWMINNIRQKKKFMTPLFLGAISFCMPYVYLIVSGRNISVWVYVFIACVFVFGGYMLWRKVIAKTSMPDEDTGIN